jgi:hypothetical protein
VRKVTSKKYYMKPRTLLLTCIFLLGVVFANAAATEPGNGNGKKDDLNGNVIHADSKKPLKDVSITAFLTSKKEKVVITDGSGNYNFDDLKPGTYKFVFEKDGYKKVTKEKVIVKVDEGFQLNIEMIEADDFDLMPSPFHFSN